MLMTLLPEERAMGFHGSVIRFRFRAVYIIIKQLRCLRQNDETSCVIYSCNCALFQLVGIMYQFHRNGLREFGNFAII